MKNGTALLLLILLGYFTLKAQALLAGTRVNKPPTEKPPTKPAVAASANNVQNANAFKINTGGIDIPMIFVQGGSFIMGDAHYIDNPQHRVTLSSFYMAKYDVTQTQWKAIMGNNPSFFQSGYNCPVEQVSWDDVQKFIKKLNAKSGKTYRLPTEAEWEYAAKGGNKSLGYIYSGSNNINKVAWYNTNSKQETHPIGQKQANELGIYDMSGNVWQWCQDWYDNHYYKSSPVQNP